MRIWIFPICIAVAACASEKAELEAPQDEPTQAAEQTLRVFAKGSYPGQDAEAAANCGVLNTTAEELSSLSMLGTETDAFLARATAAGVFSKPETQACLKANGINI